MALTMNSRQVPDASIMDKYGKQTYLGNSFIASSGLVTAPAGIETPILYISNPIANAAPVNYTQSIAAFMQSLNMCNLSAFSVVFKLYVNPVPTVLGPLVTPINLRTAETTTSRMTVSSLITASTSGQVAEITTIASQSPPILLNDTWFRLYGVGADGVSVPYYVWFNVSSAGTDPEVEGATGIEVDINSNSTAIEVAAALAAELNAFMSGGDPVWQATFDGSPTLVVTNSEPGDIVGPSDGDVETNFTFGVVSEGNLALGTLIRSYGTNASSKDEDLLMILDPGKTLMITATATGSNATVEVDFSWYEL